MKKVFIAAAAYLLMSFSPAGAVTKEQFCGMKWHPVKMQAEGKTKAMPNDNSYYQFQTDGTVTIGHGETADKYTYDYDEASKTISIKQADGKVNITELILKIDAKHMEAKQTLVGMNMTVTIFFDAQ